MDQPLSAADLHIHSRHSDGLNSVREILEYVVSRTTIRVVSITDHDTLAGSWEAMELVDAMRFSLEIIPGTEITTADGHILAYQISQPIPPLRSLKWTAQAIREQGGLWIIAHPMAPLVASVPRRRLLTLRQNGVVPDAIETHNGSVAGRMIRRRAVELNKSHLNLPATGSSDAHILMQIGSCVTLFPGETAADLVRAIRHGRLKPDASRRAIRHDKVPQGPKAFGSAVLALSQRMVWRLGARVAR